MVTQFPTYTIPTLRALGLSDVERAEIEHLRALKSRTQRAMELSEAYYLGDFVLQNLRIAVPKELEFLRTIVGWPAFAVDPYAERLKVDGFRLPNATDADSILGEQWALNFLDAEFPLGVTDALSLGRCYGVVGSPDSPGDLPLMTFESPLTMTVEWDLRGRIALMAWQEFRQDDRLHASFMKPGLTIHVAQDDDGSWIVVDRDEHGFDFVPVVRLAHAPRTTARDGRSAITPAIRSTTDSACRDLLALEVSREIYSVPGITLLGATEADFQNSDGTAKTAWETYITRVRALERDEEGNVPTIHQAVAYDPSVFTKLIEMRGAQMASMVAATPQDMGLYTQGNPPTVESVEASEMRRNRRAMLMQGMFSRPLIEWMQMGVRFQNGGVLPSEFAHIEVDWHDVNETPLSLASDALSKQVAAGMVPATSDVTLKRAGYSAVERARLEQDRQRDAGRQIGQQIVAALTQPTEPSQEPANGQPAA